MDLYGGDFFEASLEVMEGNLGENILADDLRAWKNGQILLTFCKNIFLFVDKYIRGFITSTLYCIVSEITSLNPTGCPRRIIFKYRNVMALRI